MREEMRSHRPIAELARRQHGVVSQEQLLAIGLSTSAVGRQRAAGRLHSIHRGVYAVGHTRLSGAGKCLAAVLACGDTALASHDSAGWLWGLVGRFHEPPVVTVGNAGHRRPGIEVHRSLTLVEADKSVAEGVPVTAIPRTLLDLSARGSDATVEGLLERGDRLNLLDVTAIDELLVRSRSRPGARRLRRALGLYRDPSFTRSLLERRFLRMAREHGLPRPAMNLFVGGIEIDAYWETERFAVELDGYGTHRTRAAFERDPLRQEALRLAGIDSIRITARRLEREPAVVASRLRQLLASRRAALGRTSSRYPGRSAS